MSNIKLQVGEDYLNGMFETIHILSYSNVTRLFKATDDSTYTLDGYFAHYVEKEDASVVDITNQYNLVTHIPKVNKEPSDEDILKAGISFTYSKFPGIDKQVDEDLVMSGWKAAIEWYKQQIK